MSASIQWTGLDDFVRSIHELPGVINRDSFAIVQQETEAAANEIRQDLARRFVKHTGNLVNGVRTFYPSGGIIVGIVRNVAPHAHLLEFGTDLRRFYDKSGNNGASRGRIARPFPDITPTIARRRRGRIGRALVDMLRQNNFEVTGVSDDSA